MSLTTAESLSHCCSLSSPNNKVVADDQEGVAAMMDWLSFVPKTAESAPQQLKSADPVDRLVDFVPTKAKGPRLSSLSLSPIKDN